LTSSLIALNLPDPYDQYIYCDIDEKCISALSQRVQKYFPGKKANYIVGDCNENVTEVLYFLPMAFFSKSKRGYDFWSKARFGGPSQTSLKFED
jgi:hypothetical protein